MKVTLFLAGLLVTGIVLLSGCGIFDYGESGTGQPAELSEYGGFTTGDEAPGFGDDDLLADYTEDAPFDDEMEADPRVRDAMNKRGARHYALRLVWGNLETRDSSMTAGDDCPVADWSGSVELDNGVILVERLIRFDPGDHIMRPRRSPYGVNWVSYTKDHFDGILFHLIVLPGPTDAAVDGFLKIGTPFYTGRIPLASLEDHREFVIYDSCDKISIVATATRPADCPNGFLEGGWIATSDTSGYFRGAWIGARGGLMGYLKGRYEIRDGRRLLYGKWIAETGDFQGLLRGTWSPLAQEDGPDGIFEGHWVNAAFTVKGAFRGHYHIAEGDTRRDASGFFQGRWKKDCR
jgi:hypothetical protein